MILRPPEGVPARDGRLLMTQVLLPAKGTEPRPALLYRTPYGRGGTIAGYRAEMAVGQGWAFVVQDCRGSGESEGRFDPVGEAADGTDTVAWCAQQPWCDGRVVMAGHSYLGMTAWLASVGDPPALRGVLARMSAPGFDRSMLFEGGVERVEFAQTWALLMASADPNCTSDMKKTAEELASSPVEKRPLDQICAVSDMYRRWLSDPSWGVRATPRTAAYQVTGWFDMFVEHCLDTYVPGQRLVVGPWTHGVEGQTVAGETDFGADAAAPWLAASIEDWSAEVLRRTPAGGVSVFVTGSKTWADLDSWPPPSSPRPFYLSEGSGLAPSPAITAAYDATAHDPFDPVPTLGGRGCYVRPGAFRQAEIEARPDVCVYTSEALDRGFAVGGTITCRIWIDSSAPTADVCVKVTDVSPTGESLNLVDSVRRVDTRDGRVSEVAFDVGSIAHRFSAGHRIRVQISPSNFPRLQVNEHPGQHRVRIGGRTPSSVTLPVWHTG